MKGIRFLLIVLAIFGLALAGCNLSKGDGTTLEEASAWAQATAHPTGSTGGGSTAGGTGFDFAVSANPTPQTAFYKAKDVPVLIFDITAAFNVTVTKLDVTAAGSGDDKADVSAVRLIEDVNGNGAYDSGLDREIAAIAGFTADDGKASVSGISEAIAKGTTAKWMVLYDFGGTARPGKTFRASIEAAADVDATDGTGKVVTAGNLPATGKDVTTFINTTLLVSEVVAKPTVGEFIEIYNPTAGPIDLSDYYVTDGAQIANATSGTPDLYYYNVVTGKDMGGGQDDQYDFHVGFPAGSVILPDEVQVIANDSTNFQTTYSQQATYELTQDGAGDGVADMVPIVPGAVGTTATLTNSEESVMIYKWDGASDLVEDIDYVHYTGTSGSGMRNYIDKTGVSVDGPDTDSTATAYKADYDPFLQDKVMPHNSGYSMTRVDFEEGNEQKSGGNGVDGHNEMTENLSITFDIQLLASPGVR